MTAGANHLARGPAEGEGLEDITSNTVLIRIDSASSHGNGLIDLQQG